MERWRYSVQRGDNWASTKTFFESMEDALAFIYGQERFSPHYSAEFIIRKIKVEEPEEGETHERFAEADVLPE